MHQSAEGLLCLGMICLHELDQLQFRVTHRSAGAPLFVIHFLFQMALFFLYLSYRPFFWPYA